MRPHANMVKCPYRRGDFDRYFQDLTDAAETPPSPLASPPTGRPMFSPAGAVLTTTRSGVRRAR
jgi:hypothetical protein